MPKHVLMYDYDIITDVGRRRRWTAAEKLRIVEEALEGGSGIRSSPAGMALLRTYCIVGLA